MARQLARGMGSFFKTCDCAQPSRCAHTYTIRFRNARGRQSKESGYRTQDDVIERLTGLYADRKKRGPSVAEARRELGRQTIEEYARVWLPRQRRITENSTARALTSQFKVRINPVIGSRKLSSVTPSVVEEFLDHLEAEGVGRGHQLNVYRALSALLRDAFEKGAIPDDPLRGVQKPEYAPDRVAIPTTDYIAKALTVADYQLALEIVLMVGCGRRNSEARAVNVNNIVAKDVYRVTEQVHSSTHQLAKLKHREEGEFREVPLPRTVKEALECFAEAHGTTDEGYLLRGADGPFNEPLERYRVRKLFKVLPPAEGVGMYSFRHFFASDALSHGIPITDVAEWMGHRSIQVTYRTYRHLMPGSITKAASVLDEQLRLVA